MNFVQFLNTFDQLSEKFERAISNIISPVGYTLGHYISNMSPSGECAVNSKLLSFIQATIPWTLQEQLQTDFHYAQNSTPLNITYGENGDIFIEAYNVKDLIPFQKILEEYNIPNRTKPAMLKHFPALN